ncbi:MAG: tetratricopeptide repeat protein [Verrucomicrobia bacterium]|nr:tetratricopeptide repeat protein [Verrucomicrobiota bacterium]
MIRVHDAYGRELFISREEWRKNVLPGTIQPNWNNPDELYDVILGALNDGFRSDVIDAAQQLYKIDHEPVRGACIWGIVLMEEGRLDEAEKVFRDFLAKHGEDGIVLTNLAKVYSRRNDHAEAERILWHALEIDPNQDNGMGWYWSIQKERGGEAAGDEALRRAAAIPKSWRAQLWLARSALDKRDVDQALALYHESLARVDKPVPTDFLVQMSGDLGNAGHLPEILQLVEPQFIVQTHGIQVGNNLIKAHLDLGQVDAARRILDQLYALKRMDWNENLNFWDTEIARTRLATAPVEQNAPMTIGMLGFHGPIWLKPSSPAAELFPAKILGDVTVCFLGSTAEVITNSKRTEHQMSDTRGRLSRSVPLYLAEQVELGSNARVQTLVPWVTQYPGGFVLSGVPWDDEAAASYTRQGEVKSDYVVITHLKPNAEPWTVELRLVRAIDGKCLGTLSASFHSEKPEEGIPTLARQLLTLLGEQAEVEMAPPPAIYQVPTGPQFGHYLLRLEQLLAVRCGGMDGPREFLSGEREIINGNLQLCVEFPQNIGTRILLAKTLLAMKRARPKVVPEFQEKIKLLQKEHPLAEPANSVLQRLFNEAFAEDRMN